VRLPKLGTRAHPIAIAAYVHSRRAAFSGEILDEFLISEWTLRRRRPQLERLGLRFVKNGRGSAYVADTALPYHLPTTSEQNSPT
jgi:hypothetical protein